MTTIDPPPPPSPPPVPPPVPPPSPPLPAARAAGPARRTPVGLMVVAALLAVGTFAALAVAGLVLTLPGSGTTRWSGGWPAQSVAAAVADAEKCVGRFMSVSHQSVDDDLEAVLACATGQFHREFEDGKSEVREAVLDNRVTSRGRAVRSAVVSADADAVVVLLAVDAEIKNVTTPRGRNAHYRIRVEMAPQGPDWLISRLEFVG